MAQFRKKTVIQMINAAECFLIRRKKRKIEDEANSENKEGGRRYVEK